MLPKDGSINMKLFASGQHQALFCAVWSTKSSFAGTPSEIVSQVFYYFVYPISTKILRIGRQSEILLFCSITYVSISQMASPSKQPSLIVRCGRFTHAAERRVGMEALCGIRWRHKVALPRISHRPFLSQDNCG